MEELKQLGTQREDEVEIDLGEIFHLMLSNCGCLSCVLLLGQHLLLEEQSFLLRQSILHHR